MQAVREPEFDLVQAFCSSCTAKLSLGEEEATERKKKSVVHDDGWKEKSDRRTRSSVSCFSHSLSCYRIGGDKDM